jgi:hypothetical protein
MQHPLGSDASSGGDRLAADQQRIDAAFDHGGPANHAALLYESRDEQFGAAVPFVRTGLERGDWCLCVLDDTATADVVAAMERAGIDVAAARETGQLTFHSTDDIYLAGGSFDPAETIEYLEETVSAAVEDGGYDHVRFTAEMTWAAGGDRGAVADALVEYEATLNDVWSGLPMTGLCQYDRDRFPPAVLRDVVRTHPRLVADGAVCPNAFYVPPDELLADGATKATVDRQLDAVRAQRERRVRARSYRTLVGDVIASLVTASTREAVDRGVCEALTDVPGWRFAWVGETNATSDRVTPRATAGEAAPYLDAVSVAATAEPAAEPAGRAAATRSMQVTDDVGAATDDADWRRAARDRGVASVAAVPLVYEGVSYGLVSVYSDEPGTFDDRAQSVLTDVGRAVAFACNAMDRRRALVSGRATELALALPDDDPVVDFAVRTGETVQVDGVVPEPDDEAAGRLGVFLTVEGATAERVEAAAAAAGAFTSLSLAAERDEEVTYDGVVDGTGLLGTLLDHAVVPKSVAPDGEGGRAVVRLPPGTDVASFVGMVQDRYPGTDLVARRDVEAESTTRADFRTALRERLTDRQWDALQMAYLSGYFEWPRERSGQEVGERLDVSQPTFNRHLRDSLRKLLTPIFDDGGGLGR